MVPIGNTRPTRFFGFAIPELSCGTVIGDLNSPVTGLYDSLINDPNLLCLTIMGGDGNLGVYRGTGPSNNLGLLWQTGVTSTTDSYFLNLQDDTNLCIYRGTSPADNRGLHWMR